MYYTCVNLLGKQRQFFWCRNTSMTDMYRYVVDPCQYLVVLVLLEEHLPQERAERRDTGTRRELPFGHAGICVHQSARCSFFTCMSMRKTDHGSMQSVKVVIIHCNQAGISLVYHDDGGVGVFGHEHLLADRSCDLHFRARLQVTCTYIRAVSANNY